MEELKKNINKLLDLADEKTLRMAYLVIYEMTKKFREVAA